VWYVLIQRMVKQVKRHTVSKKTKFGPKMVGKDRAWCQIEDTYSDNVCLMCPSTGHKSIFNSHDVTPDQSLFWRKPQEMTLTAGCHQLTKRHLMTVSAFSKWRDHHIVRWQSLMTSPCITIPSHWLAVYLLRTRGSYWSRGPNRVPKGREECAGW